MKRYLTILLALALLAALLSGCSGSSGTAVEAKAFSTGDVLTLNVNTTLNNGDAISYGGYQFETTKTLSELTDLITKKNDGVTAQSFENAYGSCTLFTKDASGVKDTWCLYQQDPANVKNQYIFVGTHREVELESGNQDILLPLQLISDSYLRDSMANRVQPDTAYACGLKDSESTMAQLFQKFYEDSGLYTVTAGENGGFSIAGKSGGEELVFSFQDSGTASFFTVSAKSAETAQPAASVTVTWSKGTSTDPVQLPDADAAVLQGVLTGANYAADAAAKTADFSYDYTVDADGESYTAAIAWADNAWTGSVKHGEDTAVLSGKEAAATAAVLGANGLITLTGGKQSWPGDLAAELTQSPACMSVTTNVNVRATPSTGGDVLTTLTKDALVASTGKTSNGWYEIVFGDKYAYMSADYLQPAA